MPESLFDRLLKSCEGGVAAARAIVKLEPAGGAADKVFPPTHEGGAYAMEKRRTGEQTVDTVLLDSVQSQANRFEDALLSEFRAGRLEIPILQVEIPGHEPVTSLTAPHRIHDAIFRDSLYQGKKFRESLIGRAVAESRAWNAGALYRYCPTALIFGTWDSQSGAGVGSAKVARALVSEIVGVHAQRGVRSSSRIDPLGIKAMPKTVYESKDSADVWELTGSKVFGKKGTPSEINHGNIPPTLTNPENGAGGVTFTEAQQTTVLSFAQLRRLMFPDEAGKSDAERDVLGRATLAALALYAVLLQWREGYQLRSRCQLIPVTLPGFEWIGVTAADRQIVPLDLKTAGEALQQLREQAKKKGLFWETGLIELQPQAKLIELVKKSDAFTKEES